MSLISTTNARTALCVSLAILAAVCFLFTGCGSGPPPLTINEVKLTEEDMPGYELEEEVTATRANAAKDSIVDQLYDGGAVSILNQVFDKNGVEVQVNYVQMKNEDKARYAEMLLEAAVGGKNYISTKGNIAIEIIGTIEDTQKAATELELNL